MFAQRIGVIWNQRKSMTSSFRRDTMSSWNSSSFSTPQNREKKQIARHEARSPNKNHHYVWLVCETRAKILLSHPQTSLTTSRLLPQDPQLLLLRRSRRSYGRGGSRGRVQGVRTPPSEMNRGFLIQLVFCKKKKKTLWFIGVEVEQETSAPPPKKNPGSASEWRPQYVVPGRFYIVM